jgi:hypothetical protein
MIFLTTTLLSLYQSVSKFQELFVQAQTISSSCFWVTLFMKVSVQEVKETLVLSIFKMAYMCVDQTVYAIEHWYTTKVVYLLPLWSYSLVKRVKTSCFVQDLSSTMNSHPRITTSENRVSVFSLLCHN